MEIQDGFKIYLKEYCNYCPYFEPVNEQSTFSNMYKDGGLKVNNTITCKHKNGCNRAVTGRS